MSSPLTIVMYHYVRDLEKSRYPGIKGLRTREFTGQLEFLKRYYTFVTAAEVVAWAKGENGDFPPNAVLLTFDDGYQDHWTTVFPILHGLGVQGVFFPSAKPVLEGQVMEVNKIHFILAAAGAIQPLVEQILEAVVEHGREFDLEDRSVYWERYAQASRFDGPEVVFVKRMLQKGLPPELRTRIIDRLFQRYVTADEAAFAAELYLSLDQIRTMQRCGMYIGSHGYDHLWMNQLPRGCQEEEVSASLNFLTSVGAPTNDWIMCYPHGACDDSLVEVLKDRGCALGLTTQVGLARLGADDPYRLPRLDTNDLPKSLSSPEDCPWTRLLVRGA